ncbi:MAG: Mrp/NBP35 family ATP-binding protein [Rhodospirillales bacterium]|nr:Mrp/NBP35 family ATP-binding protein [Rhodospirillales bacterium]
MSQPSEQQILDALKCVVDPDRKRDIVSLGMVQGLRISDGHVVMALQVDPQRGAALEPLRKQVETLVHKLPGVLTASVVLTAERPAPPAGGGRGQGHAHGHHGHGHGQAPAAELLPEVGAIVAVASGKGGVGKSTTAVNLALALASLNLRVGLLDADIYGPSMRRLLAIEGQPQSSDGARLDPMEKYGIKVMSMAFLVEEETPIVWRGPMVQSALEQMMRDVAWGPLDVMVVDMPPGTGDTQLTMAQRVPLAGAVIVSTPQDIALIDARKGLNMFRKVDVPVLGLIENMSYFCCPNCGHRTEIFGHGGAHAEADRLGMPFLGEIPLDVVIRETSDGGHPIVASDPGSEHARAYLAIAEKVLAAVEGSRAEQAAKAPRIVVS